MSATKTLEQIRADPNVAFVITRSKNKNVVVYEGKHTNGTFDSATPIDGICIFHPSISGDSLLLML
jgi:hypothetical protein